jgi:hypothetical protein
LRSATLRAGLRQKGKKGFFAYPAFTPAARVARLGPCWANLFSRLRRFILLVPAPAVSYVRIVGGVLFSVIRHYRIVRHCPLSQSRALNNPCASNHERAGKRRVTIKRVGATHHHPKTSRTEFDTCFSSNAMNACSRSLWGGVVPPLRFLRCARAFGREEGERFFAYPAFTPAARVARLGPCWANLFSRLRRLGWRLYCSVVFATALQLRNFPSHSKHRSLMLTTPVR